MHKNLTIITEVDYEKETNSTRNRSLNLIIKEYKKYFDTIHIICPYTEELTYIKSDIDNNVYISTFNTYNKSIKNRLYHFITINRQKKRFNKLLQLNNTDIIQLRIPSLFTLPFYGLLKNKDIPIVTYIAGDWYSGFVANYNFFGNKLVAKILENMQKNLIRNSIAVSAGKELSKKYTKLNNNIYPYFSTTHRKIIKTTKVKDTINFLYVGRLEGLKRIEDAIEALKKLYDYGITDFKFSIVGEGKIKNDLEKFINELGLNKHIEFLGYISDSSKMEEIYSKSHIFLFPSISEGTPKVLAEAMSYGVIPIAVKTTGSIRYIIEHEKNGFLVNAKSPDEIYSNIIKLHKNDKLYRQMVENCYVYAQEHTLQKEVEKMWKFIFAQVKKVNIKKIAFIINALTDGGAERVVQTLSNYLVNDKYEIHIILLENQKIAYDIDSRVQIHLLKTNILSKGIGKLLFIPIQSLELNYLLKKLEIDHAISFLVRSNLVFAFRKYFSNRRVIISERSFSQYHYSKNTLKNNFMNYLIKKLYKKADLIIPISNGIKNSLIDFYKLDIKKIHTIYNPQNINHINNYKLQIIDYDFKDDIIYFITLGRLIELKDHKTMIQAFHNIYKNNKNIKLLILGEGHLRKDLQNLIDELKLNKAVELLGFKPNPFDYLKRADIFVFSSQFEGFGNVLVEAMACGLPIISTNCPSGPSEILEDGKYGILTKVGDIEELSSAMLSILNEKNRKEYSNLSLKRAKDFDVSIIAKEYLKIMEIK